MCGFMSAADFDINISPNTQFAISGTEVNFILSAHNNTWVNSYVIQEFPWEVKYTNSSIIPINNPSLMLGIETNPRWVLSSGAILNISVSGEIISQTFPVLDILGNIVQFNNWSNVYTSALAQIEPISDIVVTKTLITNEPQITWDTVTYNIEVKNIWSAVATGINLVDVWPNSVVTFPNYWLVDWFFQVPTIYNGLANNYLFNINDLFPWSSSNVQIQASMDTMFPEWQAFTNQAFVLVDSPQYSTSNDSHTITNHVRWVADVYVNIIQINTGIFVWWNQVWYLISYGNAGANTAIWVILHNLLSSELSFVSTSIPPVTQNGNMSVWNLWDLWPWATWHIFVTWSLLSSYTVWTIFGSQADIGLTLWSDSIGITWTHVELNFNNNVSSVTGSVWSLQLMWMWMTATNINNSAYNININSNILAISGNLVEIQITLVNSGNMLQTWILNISNITGFVWYAWNTSWNISLNPQTSQTIVVTGIVGPQNFVNFVPTINFTFSGWSLSGSININEPLVCGDGVITQTEQCDTNGQIGNMLPWQVCQMINGQCQVVTTSIINTVCMQYNTNIWTGNQCVSVPVDYETIYTSAQCDLIASPSNTIIVNNNNQWSMNFTCSSQNNVIANQIIINCGNWNTWTASNVSSFTHACNYTYNPNGWIVWNTYNTTCYVDNHTRNQCTKSVRVDEWYYGICGNWILDPGEDCDLGWWYNVSTNIWNYLDLSQNYLAGVFGNWNYYCRNCRIRENQSNQFAYQPPQCLWTNTTISVMQNELVPFWWRLWNRQEQIVSSSYNCNNISSNETRTIINKDSMKCTFAVYDGKNHQQINDNPLNNLVLDCFEKDNSIMFKYFEKAYKIDFDKVSGRYIYPTNQLFGGPVNVYGEYKLVLESVDYNYCNPNTKNWTPGRLYQWICEVNFALTRPYMMQISTFGLDPIATNASDFLKDFYDMKWNPLINSTDISDTISVTSSQYGFDSAVLNQMTSFKNKYEKLAIVVNNSFKIRWNTTIGDIFNNWVVKKVPNQFIFFVKWSGQLKLKQLTQHFPETPFTIYVEGMDVLIEWSITTNGMIITDKKIFFEDDDTKNYCEEWWQVVNGIFVAKWGFESLSKTRNTNKSDERCPRWNLHIKWVLIWDWVQNLLNNRRSHLNDWFRVKSNTEAAIKKERKNEIFAGAALLIEYNPGLWDKLPPGAESFTQTLDVYKK